MTPQPTNMQRIANIEEQQRVHEEWAQSTQQDLLARIASAEHSIIEKLEGHVKHLTERQARSELRLDDIEGHVQAFKEQTVILERVETKVDALNGVHDLYEKAMKARTTFFDLLGKLAKIAFTVVTGVAVIILAYWLMQVWHIKP